jgi:hypothetical protein
VGVWILGCGGAGLADRRQALAVDHHEEPDVRPLALVQLLCKTVSGIEAPWVSKPKALTDSGWWMESTTPQPHHSSLTVAKVATPCSSGASL